MEITIKEKITEWFNLLKLSNNNKKIGWLGYTVDDVIHINTIYIYPQYRGQKYGSKLLEYLLNKYPDASYKATILGGKSNHESVGLFKKFGFNEYVIDNILYMKKSTSYDKLR